MKMEVEIEVMWPQAQGHWSPQSWKKQEGSSSGASGWSSVLNTLILDVWPQKRWGSKFLVL